MMYDPEYTSSPECRPDEKLGVDDYGADGNLRAGTNRLSCDLEDLNEDVGNPGLEGKVKNYCR
eukprot:scaffold5771_cov171-Amphora_coffeaeformis.AAC.9